MKIPSLQTLSDKTLVTFRRFPLSLLTVLKAATLIFFLIGIDFNETHPWFWIAFNGVVVCSIALNLLTALTLLSEVRNHSNTKKYLLQAAGVALLAVYYFTLPHEEYSRYEILRFMIYNFCSHLLVAFLPYAGSSQDKGFWNYNESLFLRILLSGLYSVVLYGGLAIALLAIQQLFNIDIDGKHYARLWTFIAVVFNTWFFLAGIPQDLVTLNERTTYPKGLKVFTQFVLLPLITVYMTILYAYMVRIIFTGVWPEGWVSWLVLSFSVAGVLALLLIWPVRLQEGNTWMMIYAKWFYIALFPLVILLFLSIRIRINAYGVTEGRYFVLILAAWLAVMAFYFLFSKRKAIKVIPVSLFVAGLLCVHGPWSAFNVSRNSQMALLKQYLSRNEMLMDGMMVPATGAINEEDQEQIGERINYIADVHGYRYLQQYFTADLDSVMEPDSGSRYVNETRRLMALLNLDEGYDSESENTYFNFTMAKTGLNISGYDRMQALDLTEYNKIAYDTLILDSLLVTLQWDKEQAVLTFTTDTDSLAFDFADLANKVYETKNGEGYRDQIDPELMTMEASNSKLAVRLLVTSLSGNRKKRPEVKTTVSSIELQVLTKVR